MPYEKKKRKKKYKAWSGAVKIETAKVSMTSISTSVLHSHDRIKIVVDQIGLYFNEINNFRC